MTNDDEAVVRVRPFIPKDQSDLPEGVIGYVILDDGENVTANYLSADLLKQEEEEEE